MAGARGSPDDAGRNVVDLSGPRGIRLSGLRRRNVNAHVHQFEVLTDATVNVHNCEAEGCRGHPSLTRGYYAQLEDTWSRLIGLRCCLDAAGRDAGVEPPPLPHRQRGGRHRRVARSGVRWCGAVVGQPVRPERGCSDRGPATRADVDSSEPRGRHQQSRLVQHLGQRRRRIVNRPASADDGHALVHRSQCRNRWRDPQLTRGRATGLQRRFHRDDGELARRHLLERR